MRLMFMTTEMKLHSSRNNIYQFHAYLHCPCHGLSFHVTIAPERMALLKGWQLSNYDFLSYIE